MSGERAMRPDDTVALSLPGQPSRLVARGLRHLDRPRRRLIDLGTLGSKSSYASAINDYGRVVGTSVSAAGVRHAFLWRDGRMLDLGTLGGRESEAYDISDELGDFTSIVGWSETADGRRSGFTWSVAYGGMRPLDLRFIDETGRWWSVAKGTDDHGTLIGSAWDPTTKSSGLYGGGPLQEFMGHEEWPRPYIPDVDALFRTGAADGVPVLRAFDGQALLHEVGGSCEGLVILALEGGWELARGEQGFATWAGERLPYPLAFTYGLDRKGERIVGSGIRRSSRPWQYEVVGTAFFLDAGPYGSEPVIDLGLLDPGHSRSVATSINEKLQIVGWSESDDLGTSYPFLWEQGKMLPLDALVADAGGFARPLRLDDTSRPFDIREVAFPNDLAINERGQIAGTLLTEDGAEHAFLCEEY